MFSFRFSALLLAVTSLATAQMLPQTPTQVTAGQTAIASWTKDTTGAWTDVTMTLMSGDNFQMVPLSTIATGIDGTSTTSYTFNVPVVSPNSAIYFLQFQPANNASAYEWTTRFLIAAADGSAATPPANSTQPNGLAIPWGVGTLLSSSSVSNSSSAQASATSSAAAASGTSTSTASTQIAAATTSESASFTSSSSSPSSSSAAPSSTHTSGAHAAIQLSGLLAAPIIVAGGLTFGLFTLFA